MSTTDIVLVGGGGFAAEIVTYLLDLPEGPRIKGVLDISPPRQDFSFTIPWLGSEQTYKPDASDMFLVALGEPLARRKAVKLISQRGGQFYTLIHPTAYVASTAVIEAGAIICPFAFVGPCAHVGEHAVANVRSTIGHHAKVGRFAVLSPHTNLNGFSAAGEGSFLGTNAVLTPKAQAGAYSKLAVGAVLSGEAQDGSLIVGNPGKGRVMFKRPVD